MERQLSGCVSWSRRGPEFSSQQSPDGSQPPVASLPGDLMSSHPCRHQAPDTHTVHLHMWEVMHIRTDTLLATESIRGVRRTFA